MRVCNNCKKENDDSNAFCVYCSSKMDDKVNEGGADRYISNTNILLAENEVNVKSYHCTKAPLLHFLMPEALSGDGYISITNRRVVFFGMDGRKTIFYSEASIETIVGFNIFSGVKYRKILAVILGAISLSPLLLLRDVNIIGRLLFTIIGLFITYHIVKIDVCNFQVFSSGKEGGSINLVSTNIKSMDFNPAHQLTDAAREIGAIVMDIKTLGDFALEKWSNTNSVPVEAKAEAVSEVKKEVVSEVKEENGDDFF